MVLLLLLLPLTAAVVPVITSSAQEMYESEELGFRFQIPQGWVIQENGQVSDTVAGEDAT